jgi:hypothetical protein
LLPLHMVDKLATVFTAPARFLTQTLSEWDADGAPSTAASVGIACGSAALLMLIGKLIDLPGALTACAVAGVALIGATAHAANQRAAGETRRYALAIAVAGFGMWFAIAASDVRFDFYRYLGGDLNRRGELQAALDAYVRGERYAPPDASRAKQIRELRAKLGQ